MSQPPVADPGAAAGLPRLCPTCHGPLTAKLECWNCCDRLCRRCGQPTGSAFIEICWPCWFRADAGQEPAGSVGARAGAG
jgi:hypothetical protein